MPLTANVENLAPFSGKYSVHAFRNPILRTCIISSSSDSTEIVGEILRWGSKVEVVGPQELREEVRDEAARIAAQYTGDQKGDDNGNRG